MYLDKYIKENGPSTEFEIFKEQNYVIKNIRVNDLFLAQYYNNEFNGMDIVVKYLAIENYYGLNNFGFSLYEKMQVKRIQENWNERFRNLIHSVAQQGYLENIPIETDVNYSIHDGAHRLALALFFHLPEVSVKAFNADKIRRSYTIDWFKENNFTDEEISIIEQKALELLNMCRLPYYCIFWPPARNIFENLSAKVSAPGIRVLEKEKLYFPRHTFKTFIYDVYRTDDIRIEKLNMKYSYLINSLDKDKFNDDLLPVQILQVKIDNPDFRMKTFTGLPQSKTTMRIKKTLRNEYSNQVTEYYYDILMHMTDNSVQNDDVKEILKRIKK